MARRTDGLYKRREYFYFKHKDTAGVWREKATRTKNYGDARRIRSAFLSDAEAGRVPTDRANWALQKAVDDWLSARKCRIAKGSYCSEKTACKALLRHFGPTKRLCVIATIHEIRDFETARLKEGVSPKTINNEVVILAGILRLANLWRRVQPDYRRLSVRTSDIPDALTRDEAIRLINVARTAPDDAVAPFVAVLAYSTGLRSGEIKGLRLGSIRIDTPCPEIRVRRETTKTDRGARRVALDSMAVWAVRKLVARAQRLGAKEPQHYLLPALLDRHTRPSDPLSGKTGWDPNHKQTSWEWEWDKFREAARIEHRRFHDLRHSYITRAAEAGVPLMVLQAQVGHVSAAMTAHYTHVSQHSQHSAATQIERASADLVKHLGIAIELERTSNEARHADSANQPQIHVN